jgi:hypothetical protein
LALQRKVKVLNENAQFILENPGSTKTDRHENSQRLQQLRAQRTIMERQIADYEVRAKRANVQPPDMSTIEHIVRDMAGMLQRAASGDATTAMEYRHILSDLTGGKIVMSQAGEAKAQRGWLRGTFKLQLVEAVLKRADDSIAPTGEAAGEEIVIDFVATTLKDERSEQVKQLWDQGMLMVEIAQKLGIYKSQATAALKYWFESRGQKAPDGRSRRSDLVIKNLTPPKFQEIGPEALRLYQQDMPLGKIADQLNIDRATLDKALKWQAAQAGVPLIDGRARRKLLGGSDHTKISHELDASVSTDKEIPKA